VTRSRERCAHVLELLHQEPAQAEVQLAQWAQESAAALKLKWAGPGEVARAR
jgi:hypothetical protein